MLYEIKFPAFLLHIIQISRQVFYKPAVYIIILLKSISGQELISNILAGGMNDSMANKQG